MLVTKQIVIKKLEQFKTASMNNIWYIQDFYSLFCIAATSLARRGKYDIDYADLQKKAQIYNEMKYGSMMAAVQAVDKNDPKFWSKVSEKYILYQQRYSHIFQRMIEKDMQVVMDFMKAYRKVTVENLIDSKLDGPGVIGTASSYLDFFQNE